MKHQLTRCPLRLPTDRAYDLLYAGSGKCLVEGSVEEYALDESIDAQHGHRGDAEAPQLREPVRPLSDAPRPLYLNPLRDEPSAAVVQAVRRFGVVGLVSCALASGLRRWWRSLLH